MKKLPISVLGLVGLMVASFSGANLKEEVPTRAMDLAEKVRANDGEYVLVKSASDLKSGSRVIIAAGAYNYAMSATQNTSNRSQVAITKTTNSNGYNIATWTGNVGQFTLGKGTTTSTYSFYDDANKGYLYAASSSSNYLKTQASLTTNSSWNITIASNGYATVKANGSNKRNWMRYNSSSKLFSCYSTGQKDIAIYQKQEAVVPATIAVTGVSLDKTSASLEVGQSLTLNATVAPTNATNKAVNWSSNNTAVATVSGGVVNAKAAGTATITVTTADGNKTASCVVTVKAPVVESEEGSFNVLNSNLPSAYNSGVVTVNNLDFTVVNVRNYSSNMQFKKSGYILNNDPIEGLKTVQLNGVSGKSFSGTLYVGKEAASTELSAAAKNGNAFEIPEGYDYFALQCGSSTGYLKSITITYAKGGEVVEQDIYPNGISFDATSAELNIGGTKQLNVRYSPANVNAGMGVTFASSNTAVATVNANGLVTAKAAGNATITATSTYNANLKATFAVTVKANQPVVDGKDAWTIMIYMCGNDLESGNSYHLATMDIAEILSVAGQPDDVNIIIETGGAKKWASTYGVSASYLQRWHVENKKLVKDANVTKANMGQASTFQSFLEWGLREYPAEKTGVIMWNHGGAMRGVCYDENYNDDCLLNSEVNQALSGAFAATGRTEKLEFIGYDACLMAVQDIAEFNSNYFNYMVCSEESEAGYGWDYDSWVDDLYAKKPTSTILKAVVDGFIADNGGVSSSSNDQTLSYLNLSYMPAYKQAWENMASALKNKITSSNRSSFKSLVTQCKHYADSDYIYYGIFDAKDFVTRLGSNSTFNPGSTYTNSVLSAFGNLVEYSSCGKAAGNSNGLAMFYSVNSYCSQSTYYAANQTNFTNWRAINTQFGY